MGNYISCTLPSPVARQPNAAKVIFPDGEIKQFDRPMNAAELMLEIPNHFLVNSQSLHMGRRFLALSADEDLEVGNVYVMFAMRRLNSVITEADMGRQLIMNSNSSVGGANGESTPPPEVKKQEESGVQMNLESEIDDDVVGELKARLNMCRSRRPMLETIAEETVCSR